MRKTFLVCGARPNFMKVAMVYQKMKKSPREFDPLIVHTGQHYDFGLSGAFFRDLKLPNPDVYLGVGSGNHGEQTGKIMIEFEKVVLEEKPDLIVVVGDVNSTLAASLVASKLLIPLAHIEAGLRSFDRTMPEEINRMVTDILSDYLFTTEEAANDNLKREGIPEKKVFLVGDVMVDCLLANRERARETNILERLGVKKKHYSLLTLHRPSNVDKDNVLRGIIDALNVISKKITVIFPIHPRTRKQMRKFGLSFDKAVKVIDPVSYLEFLNLEENARFVLTDSGSMQVETAVFGIPCLTIRENTERPYTIEKETNKLVGTDRDRIIEESIKILGSNNKSGIHHSLWDGRVSERIVRILKRD
jgi:UDP-N-acetylglucosamine 2-epimerase (non-hydrolysing)